MNTSAAIPLSNVVDQTGQPVKVDFKHFPVLDGLRGIAVLMVIFYHLDYLVPSLHMLVKGGFLGVDVFFVLSGFLITSILLKEHDQKGRISLKDFYLRRTLRLVPALWLFLAVLYFGGSLIIPANQANLIFDQNNFLYSITYLMNLHLATGGSAGNLSHTWSLAIEEQFYLIWSLILYKAFGVFRSRNHIAVCTSMFIIVLILQRGFRAANGAGFDILYYSTDTRIDAILIGCLASMIYCWKLVPPTFFRSPSFDRIFLGSVLFFFGVLMTFGSEDSSLFLGFISVFSLSVAVTILWLITREKSAVHTVLAISPLRWLGKISYGLYLWHYLFFEFAKSHFADPSVRVVVGVGLALAVSALSFYLVEQPILNLKQLWSKNNGAITRRKTAVSNNFST